MSTLKTLVLVLAISFANSLSANNNFSNDGKIPVGEKPSKTISKEILSLLKKPDFRIQNELEANVTFVTNDNNEIIVLNVDSDNEVLREFIKSRLNYNSLSTKLNNNIKYKLPVRLVID